MALSLLLGGSFVMAPSSSTQRPLLMLRRGRSTCRGTITTFATHSTPSPPPACSKKLLPFPGRPILILNCLSNRLAELLTSKQTQGSRETAEGLNALVAGNGKRKKESKVRLSPEAITTLLTHPY